MEIFEALHGGKCRSPIGWFEVGEFALLDSEVVYMSRKSFNL